MQQERGNWGGWFLLLGLLGVAVAGVVFYASPSSVPGSVAMRSPDTPVAAPATAAPRSTQTPDPAAEYRVQGVRLTEAFWRAAQEADRTDLLPESLLAKMVAVDTAVREMRALRPPAGRETVSRAWGLMVESYDRYASEWTVALRLWSSDNSISILSNMQRAESYLTQGREYENQWRVAVGAQSLPPLQTVTPRR